MATDDGVRKLAAILAADVAGYSRLMADDDRATIATLTDYRAVFAERASAHGGRIVDTAGDSVLATFDSVIEAVEASAEVQRDLAARNQALPDHRRMRFRIGINLGDIIIRDDGTAYGDGVNVAARLEGLAEPGGVMISQTAFDQVDGRLAVGLADAGEHDVKNIAKPVRAYRVVTEDTATKETPGADIPPKPSRRKRAFIAMASTLVVALVGVAAWQLSRAPAPTDVETASVERMAFPLPAEPSIAVLPFDNLSGDPAHDFIADGLSENIIATLAQARGMLVIARNSTFTYKGSAVKVQTVAEDLGVQFVLEGSVQVAGENIRVTAQLVDALSGQHIIAERYDKPLADLFDVQDQITLEIVKALQVELTDGGAGAELHGGTRDLDAWRDFQRGQAHAFKFNPQDNLQAQDYFRQALDSDPEYALAWSSMGWTEAWKARFYGAEPYDDHLDRGRELAEQAIAINPETGNAHTLLAMIAHLQSNPELAASHAARALESAPNDIGTATAVASMYHYSGRYEAAQPILDRVERMTPLPAVPLLLNIAFNRNALGDYAFGEAYARQADTMLGGGRNLGSEELLHSLIGLEKIEEARALAETMIDADPTFSIERFRAFKTRCCRITDNLMARYVSAFRQAGIPEHSPGTEPTRPVIAVLPFDNMSGDPEQEYFADGITEEIIAALTRFDGLRLIARGSTFKLKGRSVDVRAVGSELGADYVVEGSVRKATDTVRVTVQLLDAESGTQLWAETYERRLTAASMFAVQDEITSRIVGNLADSHGAIVRAETQQTNDYRTDNLDVYECLLRHNEFRRHFSPETHLVARTCLESAVELDPDYGEAWARLANVYAMEYANDYNRRPDLYDALGRNQAAAERAAELDPTNEWARLALARSHYFRGNASQVFREAARVVELNPNNADTIASVGWYVARAGRWDRGLEMVEQAMALNPNFPIWYHSTFFENHYRNGEYQAALARAHDMNTPGWYWSYLYFAMAYGQLGDRENGKAAVEDLLAVYPTFAEDARDVLAKWYFIDDHVELILEGLRKAGLDIPEPAASQDAAAE